MEKDYERIGLKYDKNNRLIYSTRSGKHYVIHNDDLRKYEFFYNRYLASFTLFLLVTILHVYVAIGVGILTFVVLEYLFRNLFLDGCRVEEHFVPAVATKTTKKTPIQTIILTIAYFLLGGALVAYTLTMNTDPQVDIVAYGIAALAVFLGLQTFIRNFK